MTDWSGVFENAILTVGSAGSSFLGAWLLFRGKKGETSVASATAQDAAIAARWDDASQLAEYIRAEVERQVEKQVQPIRDELATVKEEARIIRNAIRAYEFQLWFWDQRGRIGPRPTLPEDILKLLGLEHLPMQSIDGEILPPPPATN